MAAKNALQFASVSTRNAHLPPKLTSKFSSLYKTHHFSLHFPHNNAFALHVSTPQKGKTFSHRLSASRPTRAMTAEPQKVFHGQCFVVGDNIDTDQIIPTEYLTLVPSKPEEYEKLGSYAMVGLPDKYGKFIEQGQTKTKYPILIGGANFGCGSSREHAPVALGAAGVKAVVAESYARIFFRNSVATGELYALEAECRICEECQTGHIVTVDLEGSKVINHTTAKVYVLKPIGDAGPVIDAGGIFAYARKTGMIANRSG
uniref:3-isopropylmalate dehydratase n=1 Tax=Wollemia nobilis TaxID=56998 RepID=A0A0C9S6R2_9CONI